MLFGINVQKDKKNIAVTLALIVLLSLTLNGYITTMRTFFDPSNSDKLEDSLLRAGAYSSGGGGISTFPPAAIVIELSDPEYAYDLLTPFSARQIAGVLEDVEPFSHVAEILSYFDTPDLIDILQEFQSSMSSKLVLFFDIDLSSLIVSNFDMSQIEIIQSMLDSDINESAVIIEEAVKILIKNLDPGDSPAALVQFSSVFGKLDVELLLELFFEISNLPETPSTVSYLLESMNLRNSSYIIETWIETKSPETLGIVFEYFSDDYLSTIYTILTNQAREIIYEYLSPDTIDRLPSLGAFEVTSLMISSDDLELGDTLLVEFTITNNGNATDNYSLILRLNDLDKETFSGTLGVGESEVATYSQIMEDPGEYTLLVLNEFVIFTVKEEVVPLTPALFVVTSLEVVPLEIQEGDEILIVTKIINEGELSGNEPIDLMIDDELVDSKMTELQGGESTTVLFSPTVSLDAGSHIATVKGKEVEFTVEASQSVGRPWVTIIVTLVIILTGTVYLLNQRGIINLSLPILHARVY